jgi:hypothetical protein
MPKVFGIPALAAVKGVRREWYSEIINLWRLKHSTRRDVFLDRHFVERILTFLLYLHLLASIKAK